MTAREPMRLSSVEFDLVTKSEANERFASKGGMFAKAHRVASQRKAVKEALGKLGAPPSPFFTPEGAAPSFTLPNRIEITITRIGPGTLDAHDNLRAALKAVVDAVCEDWIGLRDDDPRIKVMPARQERTPGVSTQGPCPICLQPSGRPCLKPLTPTPMVKGLHATRRTPWRVRIEVRDLTPGPDRVLVLASVEPQKRKKTKPRPAKQNAPEGSEDHSARMLVACSVHGAAIGQVCGPKFRHHGGVCAARGRLAGLVGVASEVLAPREPAKGPRRIVGPPVVRVALPWRQPVLVSLNPVREIDPATVVGDYDYAHPVFDLAAIRAQARMPEIQGHKATWFAGAWMGYGFHEDGLKAGLAAARGLIRFVSGRIVPAGSPKAKPKWVTSG